MLASIIYFLKKSAKVPQKRPKNEEKKTQHLDSRTSIIIVSGGRVACLEILHPIERENVKICLVNLRRFWQAGEGGSFWGWGHKIDILDENEDEFMLFSPSPSPRRFNSLFHQVLRRGN
jgi:hypothetical protein